MVAKSVVCYVLLSQMYQLTLSGNLAKTLLPELVSQEILRQVLWSLQELKQWRLILATLDAVKENGTITLEASNYTVGLCFSFETAGRSGRVPTNVS